MLRKIQRRIARYLYKANRKATLTIGSIKGNLINAYWFDRVPNFGDLLNPLLLKYYGLYCGCFIGQF